MGNYTKGSLRTGLTDLEVFRIPIRPRFIISISNNINVLLIDNTVGYITKSSFYFMKTFLQQNKELRNILRETSEIAGYLWLRGWAET